MHTFDNSVGRGSFLGRQGEHLSLRCDSRSVKTFRRWPSMSSSRSLELTIRNLSSPRTIANQMLSRTASQALFKQSSTVLPQMSWSMAVIANWGSLIKCRSSSGSRIIRSRSIRRRLGWLTNRTSERRSRWSSRSRSRRIPLLEGTLKCTSSSLNHFLLACSLQDSVKCLQWK